MNTCVKTRLDTAEGAEVYSLSESPFCFLQGEVPGEREVRTLQHFTFHACRHRIRFGGPWAHILGFSQVLECLEELTRKLLSSF